MANGSLIFDLLPTAHFILDAGCGARGGHWWPRLTPTQQLIAVDLLERPTQLPPGARFFPIDIVEFCRQEQNAGRFDLIVADHVLEHVPDPQQVAMGFAQVATPSGYVHVGIPDSQNFTERFYHLVYPEGGGHISRLTLEGLIDLMKHAGFAEVRHERWADDWVWFRDFFDWRGRRLQYVSQEDINYVADTLAKELSPERGYFYGWEVVFVKDTPHLGRGAVAAAKPQPTQMAGVDGSPATSIDGRGASPLLSRARPPEKPTTVGDAHPLVSVIVLNYNGRDDLAACLPSLGDLDYPETRREVLVVDNGSSDGSADWVRETHPEVRLIANPSNLGFAGGIWSGAVAAPGEYLALLNADMRVDPAWLQALVHTVQREPGVVCAGSLILNWEGTHIDYAGRPQDALNLCPEPPVAAGSLLRNGADLPLLFASGGAMLIEREAFLLQGGFDPDYFLYHEDVDLGWRLWIGGHRAMRSSASIAFHRGGHSARAFPQEQIMRLAQKYSLYTVLKDLSDDLLGETLAGIVWFLVERTVWWAECRASLPAAVDETVTEMDTIWRKRQATQAARLRTDPEIFTECGFPFGFLEGNVKQAEFEHYLDHQARGLREPITGAHQASERLRQLLLHAYRFNHDLMLGSPASAAKHLSEAGEVHAGGIIPAAAIGPPAHGERAVFRIAQRLENAALRGLPAGLRKRLAPAWHALRRILKAAA